MARKHSTRGESPRKSGPISLHSRGQWFVKRQGRFFYLGRDYDKALEAYLAGKDYYDSGRRPPEQDGRLTVLALVNHFLADAEARRDNGELAPMTFRDYHQTAAAIIDVFGKLAVVEDLRPDDFARLRSRFAKGVGLVTLHNNVTRARVIFRHAESAELIDGRIRFGKSFDRPAKDKLRGERNAKGARDLTAEDVHQLLAKANPEARCWVLLGIQAGFGPTDLVRLPLAAVDLEAGWIDWPRPKTAVARRVPLWPETVQAIREYLLVRPEPKPAAAGLLFVTCRREGWKRDSLCHAFKRLREGCALGCTHYDLRRTFRTVADEVPDQPAIDAIMGHSDPSMGARYRQRIDDERLRAVADHVHAWLYGERNNAAESREITD